RYPPYSAAGRSMRPAITKAITKETNRELSRAGPAEAGGSVDGRADAAARCGPSIQPLSDRKTMDYIKLAAAIDAAWDNRDKVTPATTGDTRHAIEAALDGLDSGTLRVAEKRGGAWQVNEWLKKAVLLSFRLADSLPIPGGPGGAPWYDKVPAKFAGWDDARFRAAGFRAVPGAVVRRSAYVAPGVVLMPSFVNVGAHVDRGTMIDTWSTVGSCAQIGKNCHISGGVGIGGVLEPLQAAPVIVEDDCFIGARSEVAEGVIVEQG